MSAFFMQFWPKSCQNMSRFEILYSGEPNMLESSMTHHFKGKGLYFIVKKILWCNMFEFLLMSAQIFNFCSCFCLKLCWFIILDWDFYEDYSVHLLWIHYVKDHKLSKFDLVTSANLAKFLFFWAKFLIQFYFELKTYTNTNNNIQIFF